MSSKDFVVLISRLKMDQFICAYEAVSHLFAPREYSDHLVSSSVAWLVSATCSLRSRSMPANVALGLWKLHWQCTCRRRSLV